MVAIFGKPNDGSVSDFFGIVDSFGSTEHQLVIGCDGEFGVAKVGSGRSNEGCTFPFIAITRSNDAQCSIRGHVLRTFAKSTEPAFLKIDEIRKRIVFRGIPNAANGH